MKLIIPSRGRADTIEGQALMLFPGTTICVGEDEYDAYRKVTDNLLVHPADVIGTGPKFQWVLDHVEDPCCVMVSDDVTHLVRFVGFHSKKVTCPKYAAQVVEHTAISAQDAGVSLFGFATFATALSYPVNFKPISFNSWTDGVVGFIGRKHRYDTNLLLREDIDLFLRALLHDRIVWLDCRYSFIHDRFTQKGGASSSRSLARINSDYAKIKNRWGPYVVQQQLKSTIRMAMRVRR